MDEKRQNGEKSLSTRKSTVGGFEEFVLEKHIFSNVFEKDIRRVFAYKKAERLAKAIHLIAPAFTGVPSLKKRIETVAIQIIDASILVPADSRAALSRELLALSSVLAIGRSNGMLSPMNADIIAREAHQLLQEVAAYEDPRVTLEEMPTLAELAKISNAGASHFAAEIKAPVTVVKKSAPKREGSDKGHSSPKGHVISDTGTSPRRDAILSVLKSKGSSYIKDISTIVRDVSEKTIQRELQSLVNDGLVIRQGERRWTVYSLPVAGV